MLAPILEIMNNENDSFWCFAGQMSLMENQFEKNQPGVQQMMGKMMEYTMKFDPTFYAYLTKLQGNHIFFSFRWFLLYFKREFSTEDTRKIWEVLWTHIIPDEELVVFIALSILIKQRDQIMNQKMEFEEILRHMGSIETTMDATEIISLAITLYYHSIAVLEDPTKMNPTPIKPASTTKAQSNNPPEDSPFGWLGRFMNFDNEFSPLDSIYKSPEKFINLTKRPNHS